MTAFIYFVKMNLRKEKEYGENNMKQNEKLIVNGKVVLPEKVSSVSILVKEGRIAAVLEPGTEPEGEYEVIDAGGKIVMPGMIDTHNHMTDPGPFNFREDWYCGSCSAASGGITTICDMPLPSEPATIDRAGFELKKGIAESRSVVDFALWGGLIPDSIKDMKEMHELGCIGFKGFMSFATKAYPRISDGYLVEGMKEAASFDGLITLHAENAEAADLGCKRYSAMHCEDESCFDEARPWWTEYEAASRAVLFAEVTGARVMICHVSGYRTAQMLKEAKEKGIQAYMETCPHYLIFDKEILREKKAFAKCTPPFRDRESVEKLWQYVMDGTLDVIGSDHGPFSDEEKMAENDFWKELCGFGCNDVMLAALISEGVNKRGMSWLRLAEITSGNAAKILGLYPRKGNLLPGADADLIFIDPNEKWVYDGSKSFSKTKSVKGPYQGMELTGRVTDTFVRGERVYGDGKILCEEGYGTYIRTNR